MEDFEDFQSASAEADPFGDISFGKISKDVDKIIDRLSEIDELSELLKNNNDESPDEKFRENDFTKKIQNSSTVTDTNNISLIAVWKYFKKNEATGKVSCNQCEKSICVNKNEKSELVHHFFRNHLKSAHNISATQNIKKSESDSEDVETMKTPAKYINII